MTDVEAVNDVTREVLNHLVVAATDGSTVVEHEDYVDAEALGAALFQLAACLDEIIDVDDRAAVVIPPKIGLSLDVARDAVVVAIANLIQQVYRQARHAAYDCAYQVSLPVHRTNRISGSFSMYGVLEVTYRPFDVASHE